MRYLRSSCLFVVVLAVGACGSGQSDASANPTDGDIGFVIDLVSLEGDPATVRADSGSDILLLSFWKTTCTPCKGQLADFDTLHQRFAARGLRAFAVNIDEPAQRSSAQSWVDRGTWSFPTLVDPDTQVVSRYNPKGECPFYIALAADGRVLRTHGGYFKGEADELAVFLDENLPAS